MKIHENILTTIGNTPMVKLNKITKDLPCTVLAKVETFNPGNSIKDRMALKMIEDAEKSGALKPGGTIIEGTSGNTGMGLAIAAIIKGYKCIFTTTDKQSKEKVDALRAFGAEVIVCPTNVDPEDPRSYYSVSSRLVNETPNSWKANQYDNLSNSDAHYESTGPEIWDQTDGKITHLVVGVGTGGTICGTGRYLKEKNPNIQLLGIDTYGSVFTKLKETGEFDKNEIYPYITEGIGEDFVPENVKMEMIDHFEKVTDRDAAIYTRKIVKDEGIFVGNSAGAAIAGLLQMNARFKKDDVVVVIFHDHGTRYLGKMFNDDWMRERGFLVEEKPKAGDLIKGKEVALLSVEADEPVLNAIDKMRSHNIDQIPVFENGKPVGTITDARLFDAILEDAEVRHQKVSVVMGAPLPIVGVEATLEEVTGKLGNGNPAVLVKLKDGYGIITKQDIIGKLK
ncbi:MAG: pyridoxal-phosphate dependent enzyme [Flavobacteriales bacterium]|nr:pyridoxal-phosphate dependent enzyme [Flavobacteriales bacterium]MBK6943316.1 pyridoxal-phosphate dependent enzyme [Flavobacteriales bacterium]MBK7240805.1 pyridoxal-phosphate dependent enzyme [Flavobacteriales bacterium]MBK7296581.1 pyridoxal-phosphate dependent enzyme [Flavobacteriales bacterium]MBK9536153.1 pyridoxal-phosphate dependent enzyme [Flavobacteriales bacterium]